MKSVLLFVSIIAVVLIGASFAQAAPAPACCAPACCAATSTPCNCVCHQPIKNLVKLVCIPIKRLVENIHARRCCKCCEPVKACAPVKGCSPVAPVKACDPVQSACGTKATFVGRSRLLWRHRCC